MADNNGYKSGQVRDAIDSGGIDAVLEAFETDIDSAADLLMLMDRAGVDEENPFRSNLARQTRTETLRGARQSGDLDTLSAATGISDGTIDATGYDMLVDACSPAAHQILLKGPKGSGKTTKALDIIKRLLADGIVDKVLTNVKGPEDHPAVTFAEDISEYLEFAKAPGEKVALFDEFSTSGNAYTGQQDVEQIMSRCINAFRKSEGGSLRTMYIGHENDNDIHPLVKKQSDVVIQADGKADEGLIDQATVYRGWDAYKDDDRWFRVRGLQDVPDSDPLSFSTNYFAHVEWDLDDPETQIQRGQLIDGWEQFQDEEGGEENAAPLCQATTRMGDSCPNDAKYPPEEPQYCHNHRNRLSDEEDVSDASGVSGAGDE